MATTGQPGDTGRRCAWALLSRLALLADTRGGQAEATAVDFIGHHALVEGFADRRIQPLQQIRKILSLSPHEACNEPLLVDGNGRPFDRRHPPDADVAAGLI